MGKICVLVVEDDPIIGADLEDRLKDMGYTVSGPAVSGAEALRLFQADNPDLVLMDIQLEGNWDGIETSRRMLEIRPLPIIFLTSNSDNATFAKAKSVRPHAFLSKPFRGKDLYHAIDLAIGQSVSVDQHQPPVTFSEQQPVLLQDRFFIKIQDRMVRLFFRDILWVEADDYYCKIATRDQEILVVHTLKKFGEALESVPELMRVHRSYIINLSHIEEIGDAFVYIHKKPIPINKSAREELLARLHKI